MHDIGSGLLSNFKTSQFDWFEEKLKAHSSFVKSVDMVFVFHRKLTIFLCGIAPPVTFYDSIHSFIEYTLVLINNYPLDGCFHLIYTES